MNKVQFFYDDDLVGLELKINEWLTQNKEVKIVDTNLSALGKPSLRAGITNTEKYVFYILYTITDMGSLIMEHRAEENVSIGNLETDLGVKLQDN